MFFFTILIVIGIAIGLYPQGEQNFQRKTEPISSQAGSIEIIRLVDAQLDCEQGQYIWANWTVLMATGCMFEVRQTGSGTEIYLNFGKIKSYVEKVSCLIDSSQPGPYVVGIIVWNATNQSTDEVLLTVQPRLENAGRIFLMVIVGSVAVVTNSTAMVYWQKKRSRTKLRSITRDWTNSVESAHPVSKQDQLGDEIYVCTTAIVQLVLMQLNPLKILSEENYKQFKDLKILRDNAFGLIKKQEKPKINQIILQKDHSFFLNYLPFKDKNVAVVVISSKILHQLFIATFKNTIAELLANVGKVGIDFPEFLLKINLLLHMDRSYDFQPPRQSKFEILQVSTPWKTPLDEHEIISQDEMKQVERDLEDMTLEEVHEMIKFMEKARQILKAPKDDAENV